MNSKNSCYTYFRITGNFDPDDITNILGLPPLKQWRIGDPRNNGSIYDFASWEYGRCDDYDIYVENQMMQSINELIPKIQKLKEIKQKYNVNYTLEVVPSIYVGETNPCLAPNRDVIEFCYLTGTAIDIDLYVYNSEE